MADRKVTYKKTSFAQEKQAMITNEEQFNQILSLLNPGLYRLHSILRVYNLKEEVFVPIVKAVGDICQSNKRGIVEIYIDKGKNDKAMIKIVRGSDEYRLDVDIEW